MRASGPGLRALGLAVWLAAGPGLDPAWAQSGAVDTLGGTGSAGLVDGVKGISQFSSPQGLALRGDQQLFVADWGNNLVRAMDLGTTQMRTFVGGNRPVGLVFDRATNLFVANQGDGTIRKYDYFGNQRPFNAQALPGNAGEITALAIDRNDHLYIAMRRGVIVRMTPAGALDAQYGTPTDGREFRGVAVLDNGTVFASDAASHVIWRFGAPNLFPTVFAGTANSPGKTFGEPGYGRFDRPHQIAVGPNNTLIVADRGNHQVRVVSCAGVVSLLYGIDPSRWFNVPGAGVYPGWWDSTSEFAELREPTGIAVSIAGTVYDTEGYYHLVRRGQGLGFPVCPTQGGGTTTNAVAPIPVLNPNSGFYPNGTLIEVTASNLLAFPRGTKLYYTLDSTTPDSSDTEIVIDETGRAFIDLRGAPVDLGGLRVRAFLGTSSSQVVAAEPTKVPTPVLSPAAGYYPMGVSIAVTSTNGFPEGTLLYYTTDGTEPTTNSLALPHNGQRATLEWLEPGKDLRSLRVKAFLGPNAGVTARGRAVSFAGQPELQGEVGVPEAQSGFNAGIGSFYILPVVANLRDQQQLRSIQFVVEVRAGAGAPRLERGDVQVLPMSTNDLVQIQPAAVVPPDSAFATARDGLNRLAIAYFGTNSGFNVNGFATVAMIGIQMRVQDALGNRADIGDEYSISVTNISASSDGAQELVTLRGMPARTIRLQNISFLEGDSSPAYWYNAGDFGNGVLENGDVNNAVFAAFGFRRPYQGSDVFAAMDVYRVGVLENVIEYNDAATILRRALGFEPAGLRRSRNANGEWVQTVAGLAALSTRLSAASAGLPAGASLAWQRDVLIRGGTVQLAQPGQSVSLPVYMKADSGLSVSGMQFVADVVPKGGAPRVNGVTFAPASGSPAPALNGSTVPGIGSLPETVYARWDNLEPGIAGEVLLGHVKFAVPLSANRGQSYAVVFHHTGGATIDPDSGYLRGYLFEAARGNVWVNDTLVEESRDSSDDWKEHFFGSALAAEAAAAIDTDGDGFTNLEEYLAGTHPGARDWSARIENGRATFRWVGQAGRKYIVESTEDFQGWNAATGQITGQDAFLEHTEPSLSSKARFYRLKVQ